MNKKTNIFFHATKELTTDAFLVWLIYFLDSEEKYNVYKQCFFDNLILNKVDRGKDVHNIELKRQENRVDVILTFTLGENNEKKTVLFENKTWTTFHGNQLEDYRSIYPDCYRYIYYKLAYVNFVERKEVTDNGYDIIDAGMVSDVINDFADIHPLIRMYYDYIKETFVDVINSFHDELFINHNYDILWDASAQKYLCDILVEKMREQNVPYLKIKNGTNKGGNPWTQIDIAQKTDGYCEYLFWRIDIRSNKFYIRLNQYAEPLEEQIFYKKQRLEILRSEVTNIVSIMPKLRFGKVTNGLKESEVLILFLIDNDLDDVLEALPKISLHMIEVFNKLPKIQ